MKAFVLNNNEQEEGDSVFIELDKLKTFSKNWKKVMNWMVLKKNPEVELWLRTNLVNMVNRGNSEKKKISSLRPIHLESYRVRNVPNTRDYFTADQVYLMLGQNQL